MRRPSLFSGNPVSTLNTLVLPKPLARATPHTYNKKLGPVATTYASPCTCPDDCPFKQNGCYGESGPVSWQVNKLAKEGDPHEAARVEAAEIRKLPKHTPLRLHTYGDCKDAESARILAEACEGRAAPAWAYSHAWRVIPREAWGPIHILASCETVADAKRAQSEGYVPALVVKDFDGHRAFTVDGLKVVPCPEQTGRAATCSECRMCLNEPRLQELGIAIGFQAHGNGVKTIKGTLDLINGSS